VLVIGNAAAERPILLLAILVVLGAFLAWWAWRTR
jgi:hypothetical protein